MCAKVVLSAKANSHPFEDRVIVIEDCPIKIGRTSKENKASSDNAYFDCKVLSRQHAIILYEEGKFYLMDTASSNGSFINNIRLSKTNEESKLTEIFTGDILRFGSDVVDKVKNTYAKCIAIKVKLFNSSGNIICTRSSESRLFRATDSFEDIHLLSQSLQESLSREKMLEQKLINIRNSISQSDNISQSSMTHIFDKLRDELSTFYDHNGSSSNTVDSGLYEAALEEKRDLAKKYSNLEKEFREKQENFLHVNENYKFLTRKNDALEQSYEEQRQELLKMEMHIKTAREQISSSTSLFEEERTKLCNKFEETLSDQKQNYEAQINQFEEEKIKLLTQAQNGVKNESILLNRIKSLEAQEEYTRAEMSKLIAKDKSFFEYKQELEHRIETLEIELNVTKNSLLAAEEVQIKRDENDILKIEEQEKTIADLKNEVTYIKNELIEARARKSASIDELDTAKSELETVKNNLITNSNETNRLRKELIDLKELYNQSVERGNHLAELLSKIESSPNQDQKMKVQIQDLKNELGRNEEIVKEKNKEILDLKKEIKLGHETIQQNEIEISRLRGQIQFIEEEMQAMTEKINAVETIWAENTEMKEHVQYLEKELQKSKRQSGSLEVETEKLQTMYAELKKMRGRGDEIAIIEEQREQLYELTLSFEQIEEENLKYKEKIVDLENDNANLVKERNDSHKFASNSDEITPANSMVAKVGGLQFYEVLLGGFFVIIMIIWNFS